MPKIITLRVVLWMELAYEVSAESTGIYYCLPNFSIHEDLSFGHTIPPRLERIECNATAQF
ncbi:MAG: hypothetical protein VB814_06160, partial [Pirellulaceae bacterium]